LYERVFENVCTASFVITYTAYHILSRQQTIPYINISKAHRSDSSHLKYSYSFQLASCLNPLAPL